MSSEIDATQDKEIDKKFSPLQKEIEVKLRELLDKSEYGSAVQKLSIIPTLFRKETLTGMGYKERIMYMPKTKDTDLRLQIDYDAFVRGDEIVRKKLILENVIECVRRLDQAMKKKNLDFDGDKLEDDIVKLFPA